MKITDVQAVYPKYVNVPSSWRSSLWQIVIKIETNVGVFGYGFGGGGLASVAIVNNHFKELLIGKNIESKDDISEIWDHLLVQNFGVRLTMAVIWPGEPYFYFFRTSRNTF